MAITRQYNLNPNAAGNAAFAAGRGEYEKYLDDLALRQRQVAQGDERLRQTQQQLEIERQTVEQRERMQQRSLAFQDVSQQRQIRESDQDRRERLANANRQLAFSEINRNRQIEFQQTQQNLRTDFTTRAGIYGKQLDIAADQQEQARKIAAQQRQAVLDAQIQARSQQQQGLIKGQLQQQRAGLDAMARQQRARLGVESAYAVSPLEAQQQLLEQNSQLRQQGYEYSAQQQPVVDKLRGEIQQIQSSNLPPAIAQREIAKRQQGIAQITPEEKPAALKFKEQVESQYMNLGNGFIVSADKDGGLQFTHNPLESSKLRAEASLREKTLERQTQRAEELRSLQQSRDQWIQKRAMELQRQKTEFEVNRQQGGPPTTAQWYGDPLAAARVDYNKFNPTNASRIDSLQSSTSALQEAMQDPQVSASAMYLSQFGSTVEEIKASLQSVSPEVAQRIRAEYEKLARAGY